MASQALIKQAIIVVGAAILIIAGILVPGQREKQAAACIDAGEAKDVLLGYAITTYEGHYRAGVVTLDAKRISSYEAYLILANHEWAHYVYEEILTKEKRGEWGLLVKSCGLESNYPFGKTRSQAQREEEEFSQCFALLSHGEHDCCQGKESFIREEERMW